MNIVEFAKSQQVWVTGSVQYWGLRNEFAFAEPTYCLDAPIVMPSGSCKKTWATHGGWKSNDGFKPTHSFVKRNG